MAIRKTVQLYYPISNLKPNDIRLAENNLASSLIEVVVDDYGNREYVNKKATFETFGGFLVSSHPIFNKIDDVFNDRTISSLNEQTGEISYRYSADAYFNGSTYFNINPKSTETEEYYVLANNETVKKVQLEQYIKVNGIEIDPVKSDYTCWQFGRIERKDGTEEVKWIRSGDIDPKTCNEYKNPVFSNTKLVPYLAGEILQSTNCKVIHLPTDDGGGLDRLVCTYEIQIPYSAFYTIIGKVRVPNNLLNEQSSPYYTPEKNLWAAVFCGNDIIAITELHNYKYNENKKPVAYFSFQLPLMRNQNIRVGIPFTLENWNGGNTIDDNDMFCEIDENSVCISFYGPKDALK